MDMSDESYWELGKLIGAYLCGKKTLDQVMDGINQIMMFNIWEMLSKSLDSIDVHGPASPYDQPLMAKTNYSAQLRYELETPVRRAKEVDKAHDEA